MMDGYEQDDKDLIDSFKINPTSNLTTEEIYDILLGGEVNEG